MTRRKLLRKHILNAWRETIEDHYSQRLINSERGLQIYFCAALLHQFAGDGVQRRIFVEPRISTKGAPGSVYPDIVVCNTRQIISVIELKYLPRSRPMYRKDLQSLATVAGNAGGVILSNNRYLGIEIKNHPYTLATDAVLCWGGVYRGRQFDLADEISPELKSRFLQLNALTSDGHQPIIRHTWL
jgi:hypothetical protein